MRQFFVTGMIASAALFASLATGVGGAAQAQAGRYCAHYDHSSTNCGFYTEAQCLASISGVGGRCTIDHDGPGEYGSIHGSDTPAPPRRYRRFRDWD
jgi:hypothetical protein